jgi:hypothetical protein
MCRTEQRGWRDCLTRYLSGASFPNDRVHLASRNGYFAALRYLDRPAVAALTRAHAPSAVPIPLSQAGMKRIFAHHRVLLLVVVSPIVDIVTTATFAGVLLLL